ncbi:MAG: hypothetical protein MEQ07_09730 [Aquimonas sp.]|nr:hypothetical protein [Aquimonas sp.]
MSAKLGRLPKALIGVLLTFLGGPNACRAELRVAAAQDGDWVGVHVWNDSGAAIRVNRRLLFGRLSEGADLELRSASLEAIPPVGIVEIIELSDLDLVVIRPNEVIGRYYTACFLARLYGLGVGSYVVTVAYSPEMEWLPAVKSKVVLSDRVELRIPSCE